MPLQLTENDKIKLEYRRKVEAFNKEVRERHLKEHMNKQARID